MNTRMLLAAVLRNRRSQWTLLPKEDAPVRAGAGGGRAAPGPLRPAADAATGPLGRQPASRGG